jgi:hypothetical protein
VADSESFQSTTWTTYLVGKAKVHNIRWQNARLPDLSGIVGLQTVELTIHIIMTAMGFEQWSVRSYAFLLPT